MKDQPPVDHGTWKGTDKPAGVHLVPITTFGDLPDCPFCKYGTPDKLKDGTLVCADCGRTIHKP